jgi:hypothetical protein
MLAEIIQDCGKQQCTLILIFFSKDNLEILI